MCVWGGGVENKPTGRGSNPNSADCVLPGLPFDPEFGPAAGSLPAIPSSAALYHCCRDQLSRFRFILSRDPIASPRRGRNIRSAVPTPCPPPPPPLLDTLDVPVPAASVGRPRFSRLEPQMSAGPPTLADCATVHNTASRARLRDSGCACRVYTRRPPVRVRCCSLLISMTLRQGKNRACFCENEFRVTGNNNTSVDSIVNLYRSFGRGSDKSFWWR